MSSEFTRAVTRCWMGSATCLALSSRSWLLARNCFSCRMTASALVQASVTTSAVEGGGIVVGSAGCQAAQSYHGTCPTTNYCSAHYHRTVQDLRHHRVQVVQAEGFREVVAAGGDQPVFHRGLVRQGGHENGRQPRPQGGHGRGHLPAPVTWQPRVTHEEVQGLGALAATQCLRPVARRQHTAARVAE